MLYDPDGPIGKQLIPLLLREIGTRYNIADDADDVAEFINVLIGNGKTAQEICVEVRELVDIPIDEAFINTVFEEIKKIMDQQSSQVQQAPQTQQAPQVSQEPQQVQSAFQQQPPVQSAFPTQVQSAFPPVAPQSAFPPQTNESSVAFANAPAKTRSRDYESGRLNKNTRGGRGGISKGGVGRGGKKAFALQNTENFERALGAANGNNTNMGNKPFAPRPPKGRCPDFPYCPNKDCKLAHPTRVCFSYPECPHPPGTCNYLHPNEDQELMAKLEVTKQEYLEKKNQRPQRQETAGTLGLCKFGMLCSKDICPFGHPTPANKDARVIQLEWCIDGKQCGNPDCKKAHPSPNYQAPAPEPVAPPKPKVERTLEQCKYGTGCTKFNCPRRHALSSVPCRQGANCQRIDCTFAHPIEEECRFGSNCTNRNCLYKHSDRATLQTNTWSKDDDSSTNQRAFAVPDDQVMEHAVQEAA